MDDTILLPIETFEALLTLVAACIPSLPTEEERSYARKLKALAEDQALLTSSQKITL